MDVKAATEFNSAKTAIPERAGGSEFFVKAGWSGFCILRDDCWTKLLGRQVSL
jgi:hypothetical protein